MRTKLFLAFLLVITVALVSNLIFERLIMADFDDYVQGSREDRLYWILASIEGSYQDGRWNTGSLSESIHWGMMLGFDIKVVDLEGQEVINSHRVMDSLPPAMKRRMVSIIHHHAAEGEFERYPLYIEGRELGMLNIRPLLGSGTVRVKELIFKERGKNFLAVSFLVAGISAIGMAIFFSLSLSKPLMKLKGAAEKVARGDFTARVDYASKDEIGNLSRSFNYMAEALQKEDLLRKHLTSNIAHELRTPLAVMKAQVEGMADGIVENRAEGLENIRGEVERLTKLVEGIEDLARAEASFFTRGEYSSLNLKEFLRGIEYSMAPFFKEKGLSFTVAERGNLDVVTDVDKLDCIVKNLLSNALKFTDRGGVYIDYGHEEGFFFIVVGDSGRGIPDHEMEKVFLRFFKGARSPEIGVGIGLAIVKELVDIMAGRIEVKSTIGEGTVFKVLLPAKASLSDA